MRVVFNCLSKRLLSDIGCCGMPPNAKTVIYLQQKPCWTAGQCGKLNLMLASSQQQRSTTSGHFLHQQLPLGDLGIVL